MTDKDFFDAIDRIIGSGRAIEAMHHLLKGVDAIDNNMKVAYREYQAERKALLTLDEMSGSYKDKFNAVMNYLKRGQE